jgi:hypothetical protein
MPSRKFRGYCVGSVKSGTTSVATLFRNYRSAHEFNWREATRVIADHKTGVISEQALIDFLHQRDAANLDMDSASFNFNYAPQLAREFPDARFLVTIRDCYSWLDSLLNMLLRIEVKGWMLDYLGRTFGIHLRPETLSPDALPAALPSLLDGLLKYWSTAHGVLDRLPPSRSLVIETGKLSDSLEEIARFFSIPVDTLAPRQDAHSHRGLGKADLLGRCRRGLLEEKVEEHCGVLMRRHFPGRTLEAAVA